MTTDDLVPSSVLAAVQAHTSMTLRREYLKSLYLLDAAVGSLVDTLTDLSMLDNTLLIWTNELGKGNSHTLDNIPLVMVGGGADFKMGRFLKLENVAHNRLWLSIAHAMGHTGLQSFGQADLCAEGPLVLNA